MIVILICPLVVGLYNDGGMLPQFADLIQPFYPVTSFYHNSLKYRKCLCFNSMKYNIRQEVRVLYV